MKLLAVSTSCFTTANREFYRRLNADDFEVTLVIPSVWNFGKETLPADCPESEDPTIRFLKPTNFHQRLYRLRGLKSTILESKPDVIYFEGDPGSLMCAILGRIAKRNGIKLAALSCENLSQNPLAVVKREGGKQFINSLIKYLLIQYSKKRLACLFVINSAGLSYFKSLGFKKVVKTPLGFNEQVFKINIEKRREIRARIGVSDNTIIIAYYGRLVYEKGVHLLVKALEDLELNNYRVLIDKFSRYANAYQKVLHESILQSSINKYTIFFEAKHLEIADYMNASDITILPSIVTKKWVEQYGRVVPEAVACGNLMIVPSEGAPKEFFDKDYPFVFNSGDVTDLKLKIAKAVEAINESKFDKEYYACNSLKNYSMKAHVAKFKSVIF